MPADLTQPPRPGSKASFAPGFGQRVLLTVDTEEEFDWDGPFTRTEHGLRHVGRLAEFQTFCEQLGVVPVYLVDWPIATSAEAIDAIGPAIRAGRAEVGIQLHPWVNPPHEEEISARNSYSGNLPPELERAKFLMLREAIERAFGTAPAIYRAGRYGLGPATAEMLIDADVAIDTSVRTNFDYRDGHGPDYRGHPLEPYWVDGERLLLELPLTTVWWGMLRRQGRWVHPLTEKMPKLAGLFSRLGLLERIALTPEGVTAQEALRGIDIAIDDGLPLIVLSFHSPSLAPGHTPYVSTPEDLDRLYAWFRGIYAYLDRRGVRPTTVAEIMQAAQR